MTLGHVTVMSNWAVLGIHQVAYMAGGAKSTINMLENMLAPGKARRGKARHGKATVQAQEHSTAEEQLGTDQRQHKARQGKAWPDKARKGTWMTSMGRVVGQSFRWVRGYTWVNQLTASLSSPGSLGRTCCRCVPGASLSLCKLY